MALPDEQLDNIKNDDIKVKTSKSGINSKILLLGVPIFMIQLVAVYFITANILLKKLDARNQLAANDSTQAGQVINASNEKQKVELGKFIFPVKDIIVNPAGTDGKRLLLTSIGIDLKTQAMMSELQTREALVKDVIISTLSSKDVDQLNNTAYRDTLKTEISSHITNLIPSIGINTIYFSKYILQ